MKQHHFTLDMLKQFLYFHDLTDEELAQVYQISGFRTYRKKSVIFHEGEEKAAIYFIYDGLVKTYKTDEDGHENIVSFLKQGDMFPHATFFDLQPYPATAEALVDSDMIVIPQSSFEQLILAIPALTKKTIVMMGGKIRELQQMLQQITGQDVQSRGVAFLLKIAERYGVEQSGRLIIPVPLTNLEMANAIGTTRETVNRLLNQLRKQNIIEKDGSKLVIVNPQALSDWSAEQR